MVTYNTMTETSFFPKLTMEFSYYDTIDIDRKLLIPKNVVRDSSLFLHGTIDNNDFNEGPPSGKDLTHVTAMVI